MTKWDSHLHSALRIIEEYEGHTPLAVYLRNFFRSNPQMGSRDRKNISAMVYGFYRLGHAMEGMPRQERILIGLLLCATGPNEDLAALRPTWGERAADPLEQKLDWLHQNQPGFNSAQVFPWTEELSSGMEPGPFTHSFFSRPKTFLRARSQRGDQIAGLLAKGSLSTERWGDCFALPPGTRVEALLPDPSWYEVQDYSSQRTGEFLLDAIGSSDGTALPRVWDCCAGSGGKSILLHDLHPQIDLVVSDIRPSILQQLKVRFREAGLRDYQSLAADLRQGNPLPGGGGKFDVIILDAPCTGSGTWGRTPEQLYFFHPGRIREMQELQGLIAAQVIPYLKPGGRLVYITCSVFRKENEDQTQEFLSRFGLTLRSSALLTGYSRSADTLFAAVLS